MCFGGYIVCVQLEVVLMYACLRWHTCCDAGCAGCRCSQAWTLRVQDVSSHPVVKEECTLLPCRCFFLHRPRLELFERIVYRVEEMVRLLAHAYTVTQCVLTHCDSMSAE